MTDPQGPSRPDQPDDLRMRAERRARKKASPRQEDRQLLPPEEALRLVHELEVHQIELEMQNEELRRARAEQEVSHARYFDLYDLAPVGYFTLSVQGLVLEANLTAAKLLGTARSALVNRPFSDFVLAEDQDTYHIQRMQLAAQGASQPWEIRMRRADGSSFWAHLQAAPMRNGECRIAISDISERKRAEATIAQAESRARQLQKAESLERMAGAIAHHFNNKLQAVMGRMELALGEPALGERSAELLRGALQAALQASEMSTLLLTFLGQVAGDREPLDLSRVARRMLPLLRASLTVGRLVVTDLPSRGPMVDGYAEQIRLLLINLVRNAGESIVPAEGTVRLAVKTVSPAEIPGANRFPVDWEPQDAAHACLEVSDTGRGIAGKDLEQVFDPFYSDGETGPGLGLAEVLGIVRAHGGAVSVHSEPNRGSTFRVFLPLSVGEAPPPAEEATEFEAGGAVLLVDDDDLVRSVASALLGSLGFAVCEANGGPQALKLFEKHRDEIRLVLCDLTMPDMSGWETLTALRELAPGIRVILTSGYDRARVMAGHHPELPNAYLRKPFLLADLNDAVRVALGAQPASG